MTSLELAYQTIFLLQRGTKRALPNSQSDILIVASLVPYSQYIFIAPYADCTSTNFIGCPIVFHSIFILCAGTLFGHELVSDDSQHNLLPNPIDHALFQSYDPFSTPLIHRVFPYWPLDSGVEEEVIGGG
jgi:hypothetical protein